MLNNILAGPILRRATQNRIGLWLAMDCAHDLTLEVLGAGKTAVGRSDKSREGFEACRFQLGKNLYVYLLQAYRLDAQGQIDTKLDFETGTPLYYRLLSDRDIPLDLKAAGLTYGRHEHPLFYIPARLASVLHGSCRKPHGAAGEDCLAVADGSPAISMRSMLSANPCPEFAACWSTFPPT